MDSKRKRSFDSTSDSSESSNTSMDNFDNCNVETPGPCDKTVVKNSLSKCALCTKVLVSKDKPKLLECLHAVCSGCIRTNSNTLVCQLCRVHSLSCNLVENTFFSKFMEKETDSKFFKNNSYCSNCELKEATKWCMDCDGWICDFCTESHSKLKITKSHIIKTKNQMAKESKTENLDLSCKIHPQEHLSLYCTDCDKLTCRNCQLFSHKDHSYKFKDEVVKDTHDVINSLHDIIGKKKEMLNRAKLIIKERQEITLNGKESIVSEINKLTDQLNYLISVRGKELICQLEKKTKEVQKVLDEKRNNIQQLIQECDRCTALMNFVSQGENSLELLYGKKALQNHLNRVVESKADVPNPRVPVDIHLIVDNLSILREQISTIGQIIFDGIVISYPTVDHMASRQN